MKKNLLLYILLAFLIAVNGFFLFNYLGKPSGKMQRSQQDPMAFIAEQLDFNEKQLAAVKELNRKHHKKMRQNNDDLRGLKDALFSQLSNESLDETAIDSITSIIGVKEQELDKMAFYHFRSIQELCNETQKEEFKKIINDGLKKGGGDRTRTPKEEGERSGPPPPRGDGRQGPPPGH
ncbi:Spy/CpxP family protein refolding chaperone [Algibacter miyuki]|uniref:Spy/CpxP family protein refolding chaperone n=1 Tax=Algibacter miyuki TaxID=1306933 RepID=A0ABV5H2F6_9FLAO|nr:hypothetical protein [Algibacter miyuki]MDN3666585.1 hypothetical protein [Algibacter miyuki]